MKSLNAYQWFTIILSILLFVVAIYLGNTYKIETLRYPDMPALYNLKDYKFNYVLTVSVIFSDILLTYFMFSLGTIINELRKLNNKD